MKTNKIRISMALCIMVAPALALAATGDYGVDVTVLQDYSGCGTGAGEGEITFDNNNAGVWIEVKYWGQLSDDNLYFKNDANGPADISDCTGTTPCLHACPFPDPDCADSGTGGCDYIQCCEECACEVVDQEGVGVDPLDSEMFGCTMPKCINDPAPTPSCDNTSCPGGPNSFCVELQGSPGAHAELQKVSYDGTCFISKVKTLSIELTSSCQ